VRLDDLLARLIWVPDGDNDELDRYAALYRDVIGPPPLPPPSAGGQRQGSGPPCGEGSASEQGGSGDASNRARDASKDTDTDTEAGGQEHGKSTDGHATGDDADDGVFNAGGRDGDGNASPTPQSLSDALAQAMAEQRDWQLEQLNDNVDLQKLLKRATQPEPPKKGGGGTGRPREAARAVAA
jgi:hypothetical protein